MSFAMLKLESFDHGTAQNDDDPLTAQDAESLRARAFEEGYGAGWSDALAQMRNEDALRRAASEEALQGIAFGFHEARSELESSFVALASELVDILLPELLPRAMQQVVSQELRALAARQFRGRMELLCATGVREVMSDLIATVPGLDITLVDEPSFTEQQVMLRVDQNLRHIDLDGLRTTLRASLTDISQQKDTAHG